MSFGNHFFAVSSLLKELSSIHVLEAARLGLVPRVTRRLTGHERSMIRPGTVWVWEEGRSGHLTLPKSHNLPGAIAETNMRRWTDGRRWGASRVGGGGFLVYTECAHQFFVFYQNLTIFQVL